MTHTEKYLKSQIKLCNEFIENVLPSINKNRSRIKKISYILKLVEKGDFKYADILLDKEILDTKEVINRCHETDNVDLARYWENYLIELENCKRECIDVLGDIK